MSEFYFQKSQRVIIPANVAGAENVQGVVTGNFAKLGREPIYDLQWQSPDTVDEHFNLITTHATIAESELIKAQPPKMVPIMEAEAMAQEAFCKGGDCERAMIRKEREARAAKRKRPAKSRRRR